MATGIEAEMARFEEEVLRDAGRGGRGRHGPGMPDLPPPPFMQQMNHGHFDHSMPGPPMMYGPGPMPGHNDMMMGMGPMGPGPMMMGPGMGAELSSPPVMAAQPKVYSAPPQITRSPQITKRKAESEEPEAPPAKQIAEINTDTGLGSSGIPGIPASYTNTFAPRVLKLTTGSQAPSAFNQATAASGYDSAKLSKKKKFIRTAAGQSWEDPTLQEWDPNDYRIFCGDLGNEVTDDVLARVFNKYTSFQKARIVREKHTQKSRGYGFVSFKDPNDFIRAMREMNGKYVGNRPIKLRKSNWKDRNLDVVRKKIKEKKKLGYKV